MIAHRVSVIIPTFNRARTLRRAVDSVLAQTREADEFIVVDDGSTDGSADILEDYRGIRFLVQTNRGVSAARNAGIRIASGDWLAFLDSDDEWRPRKLERQLEALQEDPAAMVIHCDEIWIRNGRRVNPMKKHRKQGGWIFQHCLPLCSISASAALIHRNVFGRVGLFDERLPACEDYDLWLRICSRYPVHFVDEALVVKYGGHADQLSRRHPAMDRFRVRALHKLLQQGIPRDADRRAAVAMLLRKARIVINGAGKRGRHREAREMEQVARQYDSAAVVPAPSGLWSGLPVAAAS